VEGQGEAPIGAQPDFFAFMGSDSGFLSLVVRPNIERVSDLAGRTLSVDAMTTGYAFVLFEILRRYGLQLGEFQVRRVGGMVQRYNSLVDGSEDGTLLSAPYSTLAKHHGLTELLKATSLLGSYQGNVAAARRSWASKNETQVLAFIRGYREAITWLYGPPHREDAIGILMRNVPQVPRSLAEVTYTELLNPEGGFFRDCAISLRGMECVLDLRSRYCGRDEALLDPMKYCDLSYYRWAIS
jgi:ABC-type nitrate/sulfonate/bicarbonate transport system substrate-binding protein